jgi:hypothetical protein
MYPVRRASTIEGMPARERTRSLPRVGRTAALVGLAVLVLAAPASAKGPSNGKGGPPPWAGGGGSKGGPPAWAGSGTGAQKARGAAKNAEKGLKKASNKAAKARDGAEMNPAMTCFALLGELGEEFFETYGTNPNNANAFGKCVSEHAREQGEDDDEAPDDASEEPAECEQSVEGEEPAEEDPLAELASLDEDTPAEGACDPADETGDPEDVGDPEDTGAEDEAELTCFLPAAARLNPFAVCVRA